MSDLYARAVRLLARREHTRAELLHKLAAHGTPDEIEMVLNQLAAAGLQSDVRFTESYLRAKANRQGPTRLRQTLRTKGVDEALIEAQMANLPDELERARDVWAKKFPSPPANLQEWVKQARFLQGRGFSADVIRKLLKEIDS
ncbi:recombination regulator RecX [Sulfuricystis thermophila]|uniref:recombination regulator RecX n=1 Tax=Sulfuricystis thermophila TaxID=2496847 RepID=UPI001036B65B|nr:recombination regulator RecX [Sulfuricystis thermophila]